MLSNYSRKLQQLKLLKVTQKSQQHDSRSKLCINWMWM